MTTQKPTKATAGRRGTSNPMAILQEFRLNDEDREWMRDSACRHRPDLDFFDMYERSRMRRQCIELCQTCPVRQECHDYAVTNEIWHGIWGGKTPNERASSIESTYLVTIKP
jgi:hypothetical protein